MSVQALEGTRVVDFSEGMAGSMAAMVLADYGAEVIKVERPGGDPGRESPGFLMWNRGKRSVVLDLETADGRAHARALAAAADVVVETFRPGGAARAGLAYADLASLRPSLVVCSISGFGHASDLEHLVPDEAVVSAKSGRMSGNNEVSGAHFTGRPVFSASPSNSFGAAMLAVEGIAAALIQARRTGVGQRVTTSILDGASAATMRLAFERDGDGVVPAQQREGQSSLVQRGIRLTFLTAECSDGRYIQMCARQDHHFREWLRVLGLQGLLDEERFAKVPLGLKSMEDAAELEAMLREGMLRKTQDEWMRIFTEEADVGGDPFLQFEEFLEHPQMTLNGRVLTIEDEKLGPVVQIGPLALMSATPSRIGRSAPALGEAQDELPGWLERPAAADSVAGSVAESIASPLDGITIVEVAQFLAGPLGPTLLGELGARVIKVEPPEGDSFRRAGLEFVHIVRGKESIAVDLKAEEGRRILAEILAGADALVHNFRPGVAERLGMGFDAVHELNPRLVYVNASSYGSLGPQARRAAFHSTPHALSGAGVLQGGEGNLPIDDSYPDPCAGLAVAAALAIALVAREQTDEGQYVETTMLTATGYVHSERLTKYPGAPAVPVVDQQQRGLGALYRLYECRDGWIFLASSSEDDWRRLARALDRPAWLDDPRFSTGGARRSSDGVLGALLDDVFRGDAAAAWERRLTAAGVPAAEVGRSFEEFLVEAGMVEAEEHPAFGTYWRLLPRVSFSRSPNRDGHSCAVGEHTRPLLAELGYDDKAIDALLAAGVVLATDVAPALVAR